MVQQPVSERIKILLNRFANGNKAELGRAGGVSGQAIADLIEGKKGGPSFPVVQNLLTAYSDVSAEWLVFGRGEMLKSTAEQTFSSDPQNISSYESAAAANISTNMERDLNGAGFLPSYGVPTKVKPRQQAAAPALLGLDLLTQVAQHTADITQHTADIKRIEAILETLQHAAK